MAVRNAVRPMTGTDRITAKTAAMPERTAPGIPTAEAPGRAAPSTALPRLPAGLEDLQGGEQPQLHAVGQGDPVPLGQNGPLHGPYTSVSMRREATRVTFSSTMLPRVAFSWMELHWQSE